MKHTYVYTVIAWTPHVPNTVYKPRLSPGQSPFPASIISTEGSQTTRLLSSPLHLNHNPQQNRTRPAFNITYINLVTMPPTIKNPPKPASRTANNGTGNMATGRMTRSRSLSLALGEGNVAIPSVELETTMPLPVAEKTKGKKKIEVEAPGSRERSFRAEAGNAAIRESGGGSVEALSAVGKAYSALPLEASKGVVESWKGTAQNDGSVKKTGTAVLSLTHGVNKYSKTLKSKEKLLDLRSKYLDSAGENDMGYVNTGSSKTKKTAATQKEFHEGGDRATSDRVDVKTTPFIPESQKAPTSISKKPAPTLTSRSRTTASIGPAIRPRDANGKPSPASLKPTKITSESIPLAPLPKNYKRELRGLWELIWQKAGQPESRDHFIGQRLHEVKLGKGRIPGTSSDAILPNMETEGAIGEMGGDGGDTESEYVSSDE